MSLDAYYEAYRHGFRAGEVDRELGNTEGANFAPPPEGLNPDAWHQAQLWGYEDGLDDMRDGLRDPHCVLMHLDNDFTI